MGIDAGHLHVGQCSAQTLQGGLEVVGDFGEVLGSLVKENRGRLAGADDAVVVDVEAIGHRPGDRAIGACVERPPGSRDRDLLDFVAAVEQRKRTGDVVAVAVDGDRVGQRESLDLVGEVAGIDVRVGHRISGGRIDDGGARGVEHLVVPIPDDDEVAVVVDRNRLCCHRALGQAVDGLIDQHVVDVGGRDAQQHPLLQGVDLQRPVLGLPRDLARLPAEPVADAGQSGFNASQLRRSYKRHLIVPQS